MTTQTPARIHPDHPVLVRGVVAAVGLLAVTSFIAGVPGLLHVAEWAELPVSLRWVVPVLLDGALLIYGAVVVVQRARREPARFAWGVLASLTAASVAAQVAHVLAGTDARGWQVIVGACLAGSFPALVFASTHTVLGLAVAPAPTRKRRAAAKAATAPVRAAASAPSAPSRPVAVPTPTDTPAPRRVAGAQARQEALALHQAGMSQRAIAARLGVGKTTVGRWLSEGELVAA